MSMESAEAVKVNTYVAHMAGAAGGSADLGGCDHVSSRKASKNANIHLGVVGTGLHPARSEGELTSNAGFRRRFGAGQ